MPSIFDKIDPKKRESKMEAMERKALGLPPKPAPKQDDTKTRMKPGRLTGNY